MHALNLILGIVIGIVASWLLGFLLVEKETLRELESEFKGKIKE